MTYLISISGYWPLNTALCDIYVTSDVLMCTSSILHLFTISLERYLAIRNPLSSRTRSKTAVRVKIALVWATSLAISSPIMILGIVDEKNILHDDQCVLMNNDFIIYGSLSVFFIPLAIMGILFGFTIRLLRTQYKMCDPKHFKEGELSMRRSKSTQGGSMSFREKINKRKNMSKARRTRSCSDAKSSNGSLNRASLETMKPLLCKENNRSSVHSDSSVSICNSIGSSHSDYRLNFRYLRQQSVPIEENENIPIDAPEMDDGVFHQRCHSTETSITTCRSLSDDSQSDGNHGTTNKVNDVNENKRMLSRVTKTFSAPSRLHDIMKRKSSNNLLNKKDSVKQKQVKNNVKTEQKASKTLGILFATFVICWGPFFVVNIMTALCNTCTFDHMMVLVFVWLGYVSSTLNPIVYTVFNKTFRTTFIKLLKCQYRTIQKPSRLKAMCVGVHMVDMQYREGALRQIPL